MSPIESNLQHVRAGLDAASAALPLAARAPVTLVAVSKAKPEADIRAAFDAGQRDFGENYVQEAVAKIDASAPLRTRGMVWHFIGPLQSNKAKLVARNFDWMQTIDRLKIARALSEHRAGLPARAALNVCIQVNVSGESSKSGVAPADALNLAREIVPLPGLKFRGLMTVIENTPDQSARRAQFRMMKGLFESMKRVWPEIDTLSMGMSDDYALAIAEGATMVRIGGAVFGARAKPGDDKLGAGA